MVRRVAPVTDCWHPPVACARDRAVVDFEIPLRRRTVLTGDGGERLARQAGSSGRRYTLKHTGPHRRPDARVTTCADHAGHEGHRGECRALVTGPGSGASV